MKFSKIRDSVTLQQFTALLLSDIEQNLIEEGRTIYTAEEIINQLENSGSKIVQHFEQVGYATNEPLIPNPLAVISLLETI